MHFEHLNKYCCAIGFCDLEKYDLRVMSPTGTVNQNAARVLIKVRCMRNNN